MSTSIKSQHIISSKIDDGFHLMALIYFDRITMQNLLGNLCAYLSTF